MWLFEIGFCALRALPLPLAGGGRRARQRNCAPERGGWGNRQSTRKAHFAKHPPPQPSPARGQGAHHRRGNSDASTEINPPNYAATCVRKYAAGSPRHPAL